MRTIRRVLGTALFGAVLVASGSPAHARLDGDCSASGYWNDGDVSVDAAAVGDRVVTIPRRDTVDWTGSVGGAPGAYSGSVWLELPPPLPAVTIESWEGDSTATSNEGSEEYDLPKFVPAGVEFKIAGEHTDSNGVCSGYVRVQIAGGAFESPITYVALALTLLFGGVLAAFLIPFIKAIVAGSVRSV